MTIFFPDLSHYKTPSLDGAVALITKATQGTSFVDSTYGSFRADAIRRGIPFAGYHWIDTSDLGAQAANAYRIMGNTPCMWDAEASGATVARIVDITKQYRALGGNPRLVYLPHWWWQDHLGSPSLQPLADLGLGLVSSAYPAAGYSETGVGWNGYGGVTPVIWQYTDKQPFNGWNVDFNAYKGTVDSLRTLFNGTTAKEPTMFLARLKGAQPVVLSTGLEYRGVVSWATAQKLMAIGVQLIVADDQAQFNDLCGQSYVPGGGGTGGLVDHTHEGGTTGPVSP